MILLIPVFQRDVTLSGDWFIHINLTLSWSASAGGCGESVDSEFSA